MTRSWRALLAGAALALALAGLLWPGPAGLAASLPAANPATLVQWGCYQLVVSGCVCPGWPPRPCVFLRYWQPALLINTQEYVGITAGAQDRFHETRVWPFPIRAIDPAGCLFPCPDQQRSLSLEGLLPYYLSDIDPLWRSATWVPRTRVGAWGFLEPRVGWVAGSQALASALTAYRGADIATNSGFGRILFGTAGYRVSLTDNINLGYPKLSMCLKPGAPLPGWETGAGTRDGHFLWVYWKQKTCCIDPEQICAGGLAGLPPALAARCAGRPRA